VGIGLVLSREIVRRPSQRPDPSDTTSGVVFRIEPAP
jgi:hypothetical protein